ncbi:membrane-bound lytic murein transglycosylase B [Rubricella aquisinus]|uniref:Membrane-bound lytic murein transglycosylase B n=1 Tax=Rubricella aquisinus TaxID=2028108 RepID=A0A840X1E6_9RHOB|nr:lytic murein transglycosylase [Rubricella aquisinus]MBB5517190.1 membrane-bound lytic murein transglycosylase B [Rubricella aquisinus]
MKMLLVSIICAMALPAMASAVSVSEPPMPRPSLSDRAEEAQRFADWRDAFRVKASEAGITAAVFDEAFRGVTPSKRIIELDGAQPEFVRPISDYLSRAVSARRISDGRRALEAQAQTLAAIEARYGVDREVVVAIWGLETAYGAVRGDFDVIRALATLAHDGRRQDWAEGELIAALSILQSGDVAQHKMIGSWAGAMGHTQFMPSSYLTFAEDFRGEGRRDVWSEDPTDALASTARYLAHHGWVMDQPWGMEVRLPADFNFMLADRFLSRPAAFWNDIGVRGMDGGAIPDFGPAAMLAPMGATGPVFVTFNNFDVIKTYNRSNAYALAIGHLGDRMTGGAEWETPWPTGILPLNRDERTEVQERLTAMGYDTQGNDGMIGPNSERAIKAFQLDAGLTPDGLASNRLLTQIRRASGG